MRGNEEDEETKRRLNRGIGEKDRRERKMVETKGMKGKKSAG